MKVVGIVPDNMIHQPGKNMDPYLCIQDPSNLCYKLDTPMLAELRATDDCFEEIAVTISLGNSTREVYAHPVSKILVAAGTHVPCSSLMPVVHYLHPVTSLNQDITDTEGLSGQWFSFNTHPTLHAPLERMSALIPLNHVFQDISAVAHGSLFQAKVLDDAIEAIVGGHNNRALQSQVFIADSQGNVKWSRADNPCNSLLQCSR